jgi:sugar phosphate isomerase/epimerase
MESEADWKAWFDNYAIFILHYADVAEAGQMQSLCIGTELHQTVKQRPDDWRALIKKIRKVYHGELTYAANFYKEYEDVTFWDELDFIGIQGYFPLTNSENPTVEELLAGWKPHVQAIEELAQKYGKQVVFTEIGYKSTKDAAINPWDWPDFAGASHADTSTVTQARCYEAMFQTFADKEWLDGLFIWKWHPGKYVRSAESEARRAQRTAQGNRDFPRIGFTPHGKAAQQVMKKWFKAWHK